MNALIQGKLAEKGHIDFEAAKGLVSFCRHMARMQDTILKTPEARTERKSG